MMIDSDSLPYVHTGTWNKQKHDQETVQNKRERMLRRMYVAALGLCFIELVFSTFLEALQAWLVPQTFGCSWSSFF